MNIENKNVYSTMCNTYKNKIFKHKASKNVQDLIFGSSAAICTLISGVLHEFLYVLKSIELYIQKVNFIVY